MPVADRAEQAAVHQVGVQAALLGEVAQHLLEGVHDLVARGVLGVAEVALQPAALVDGERVALGVDDADPPVAGPNRTRLGVQHVAADVVDQLDVGDARRGGAPAPWARRPRRLAVAAACRRGRG